MIMIESLVVGLGAAPAMAATKSAGRLFGVVTR